MLLLIQNLSKLFGLLQCQEFLFELQNEVTGRFYTFINDGTLTSAKTTFQAALAEAQGRVRNKWKKMHKGITDVVGFCNILDAYDYLGVAGITVQSEFGMNYIENFLGLGTVIMTSRITAGTFIATAKENIIMYYLTMNGDIASAFDLTADELGYIGIKSGYQNEERAQIESLVMDGIQFFVEYAAGVVKGTITTSA